MDNRNNPYGPYLLYLLSQMMKGGTGLPPIGQITGQNPPSPAPAKAEALQNAKETGPAEDGGRTYFGQDETGCSWRREERIDLLEKFCREGCFMARKHGHFLIGQIEMLLGSQQNGRNDTTRARSWRGNDSFHAGI